jgi:hypothetical protein
MVAINSLLVSAATAVTTTHARFTNSSYETGVTEPIIDPIPSGITLATSFNVSVRSGNSTWQPVGTYPVTLYLVNPTTGGSDIQHFSVAYFDFLTPLKFLSRICRLKRPNSVLFVRHYSHGPRQHHDFHLF